MTSQVDHKAYVAQLKKARKWCAAQMVRRWKRSEHPSHEASKILEEADQRFELGSNGVEGHAWGMHDGFSYLNQGDPYDTTLICRTWNRAYRFTVGSWGRLGRSG